MSDHSIDRDNAQAICLQGTPPAKQGSDSLIDRYYKKYWNDIRAYIRSDFDTTTFEPEDVIQQVFFEFAQIKDQSAIRSPKSFLKRMAHNIIISGKRKEKVRASYTRSISELHLADKGDEITPERAYISREHLHLVRKTISEMPRKRRRMLLLKRIHGLTFAEIAERFGVSPTCVKKHVARATLDLQKALADAEKK